MQCVAACGNVWQCVAMCGNAMQYVTVPFFPSAMPHCTISSAMPHNVTRLPLPRLPQAVPQPQAPGAHEEPECTKVCHKYVKTYQKAKTFTQIFQLSIINT